jgi:hypothetical protein
MSKTNESTTYAASAAPLTLLQSFEGLLYRRAGAP